MSGKGSTPRAVDQGRYGDNYDVIFRNPSGGYRHEFVLEDGTQVVVFRDQGKPETKGYVSPGENVNV